MLRYSVNVLWLSALISIVLSVLLYLSLNRMFVRPMRNLSDNMVAFSAAPDDPARVIVPTGRTDEIGVAEEQLAGMQSELQTTLNEQRHLADLGLAVSKINHDLRNMLASAQLFSDRLGSLPDPTVQRFAPKLIAALDRAIAYCQTTLAYGRAREEAPARRLVALDRLVDDVADALGLVGHASIRFENAVPPNLEVDADPDQLFRVLLNLCRNAVQAMEHRRRYGGRVPPDGRRRPRRRAGVDHRRRHRPGRAREGPRPPLPGFPGRRPSRRHRPRPRHRRRTGPRPWRLDHACRQGRARGPLRDRPSRPRRRAAADHGRHGGRKAGRKRADRRDRRRYAGRRSDRLTALAFSRPFH